MQSLSLESHRRLAIEEFIASKGVQFYYCEDFLYARINFELIKDRFSLKFDLYRHHLLDIPIDKILKQLEKIVLVFLEKCEEFSELDNKNNVVKIEFDQKLLFP